MMKFWGPTLRAMAFAVASILAVAAGAARAEPPTAEQVRTLTLKAAALIERDGVAKAREVFHRPGEFRFGEIYVNVIDPNGTWLIYPPSPGNEGKSVLNVRDAQGKLLVQEILRVAAVDGEGWVEYHWLNPDTNQIQPKLTFVKKVGGQGVVAYVGLYKRSQ
jgi:cytochrome c